MVVIVVDKSGRYTYKLTVVAGIHYPSVKHLMWPSLYTLCTAITSLAYLPTYLAATDSSSAERVHNLKDNDLSRAISCYYYISLYL